MSNVAALLYGRSDAVGDGVYLERTDPKELALEEHLRAWLARVPRLVPLARRWRRMVNLANAHEPAMKNLDDAALVETFRSACAAVREAATRTVGMRHFDGQLVGGWTLLQGRIAEMETGEGKTLVATLPACAAAAAGAAVHVVTVNDYLAARDAEVNAPLYKFMGLSVGVIKQDMPLPERRAQYACDIVYVSNKELVFDYLKDRIAAGDTVAAHLRLRQLYRPGAQPGMLLRGLHMAIVDEADSVLIDEARTPLIISETWRHELLQKAVTAVHCYHRDRHYIIAENKVQIVDEYTGRVMPDRSWEQGLHQMIEAKEGCEITGQRKTLSRMTYQRFFRRYLLLSGMTGTASEVAPELRRVYDLDVLRIPTNKPSRRRRLANTCRRTHDERWAAVADRAAELGRSGRAVLVGTRSVEASERLSDLLRARGVEHTVLNARQDKSEAEAVAQGGRTGRITVATNMAGRGTDIRPEIEVLERGGLHVILTEFHESSRIDRQLFGRSARQGEPGTVEAMVSLEDELFQRFAPALRELCLKAAPAGGIVPRWLLKFLVLRVQQKAERHNRRIRLETLKQDKKLQTMLGFAGSKR